jgi:tetratricopeptide (TPR) repeat protein
MSVSGMVPHAATVGRNEELTAIEEFLGAVADGPAALVLEGEPGIGKTTLWQTGVNRARELEIRVLVASPVEAETKLSLSTLGDLLYGVIEDVLPVLPAPQRRALEIALLLEDGGHPPIDPRTLGVSLVNSLATLAESTPVLVAIDDVQWADPASATVLAFALRRLGSKRVSLLAAKLPEEAAATAQALSLSLAADTVPRLRVGPLSLGALHHLLSERLGLVLARSKLRRLHKLCAGNPLYGLELGRAIQRGLIRLEPGESPPSTLAALIQDRLAALPNETRAALLVASALSQPTLGAVARTAGGDPEERLAPALEACVVELDEDRILFTHPLLASGAYATAGPGERRELHRRLAHIVPDPEEQARHLALGARGPDAEIAARLEAAARRAHASGAMGAAAELSDLALRLTPLDRDEDRHQREIQAADWAFVAGESGRAKEVLEEALASTPAGPRRARVLHGLGGLEIYDGNRRIAVDLFRRALAEAGDDLGLRAQLEDRLASALFLMRTDLPTAARHAQTAVALAEKTGDVSTHVSALAEQGLIEALLGRAAWRVTLARGISLERQTEPVGLAHSASLGLATNLTWSDELDEARTILRSLRDLAQERAEESALPWILANLSLVEYLAGRWSAANQGAEDGAEISLQTGPGAAAPIRARSACSSARFAGGGGRRPSRRRGRAHP